MVETQHTWIAEVGENIQLSCQFVDIHGVQEVTWQKVLGSTTRDVSSYNLLAGEKVYPPFKDTVQFAYSGFKNNSITIKNVTEQDVGCYLCLFTAYPLGNVTAETCLRFNELHGPFIVVRRSRIPPESLVTCSATGQPAPTVTLTVYQKTLSFSYYSTRSKINANGTVTVITTALLSAPSNTLVGCSVEVDFTGPRELLVTVPGVKMISGLGEQFKVPSLATVIQTQQTVLAALGEDAPLSCQLLETKDVQQVTWQKVLEKTERNIGSYSEYYGKIVNPGFKDKVQFTEAGLQKNSIVIRNVTEEDAGCYLCLFNTYPDGALTGRTCLKVYELHGPFIDVSRSNSPPGSVVTCSATGRPIPMVTLTVSDQNLSFSHYTIREINTNGTVTVTTTAQLSAAHRLDVQYQWTLLLPESCWSPFLSSKIHLMMV